MTQNPTQSHGPETYEKHYGSYQSKIYLAGLEGHRPILTTDPKGWERAAKKILHADSYGYIAGGAGGQETMDANRAAFRKWTIIPRMLRDNTVRNMKTTLFGTEYPSPVLVAPVGVNKIVSLKNEMAGKGVC
jgi:lactate 2-monooxygenase